MKKIVFWAEFFYDAEWIETVQARLEVYLSPPELMVYQSMAVPKRKVEWLAGRVFAKQIIKNSVQNAADVPDNAVEIRKGILGAPEVYVQGLQLPIRISVSHSQQAVLAAVCTDPEIEFGIDMEVIEERDQAFIDDYFTPSEREWICEAGSAAQALRSTLLWSAKESVLKALRIGLRVDTRSVEVSSDPENNPVDGWNRLTALSSLEEQKTWQIFWQVQQRFVLTLCVPAEQDIDIKIAG